MNEKLYEQLSRLSEVLHFFKVYDISNVCASIASKFRVHNIETLEDLDRALEPKVKLTQEGKK